MLALLATLALSAEPQDHAARVERLVAVLPRSATEKSADDYAADRSAALLAANPAKSEAIVAVNRKLSACRVAAEEAATGRSIRAAIAKLDDAEIELLTEFYSGPDFQAMAAAGDKADITALMARYPLKRFSEVISSTPDDKLIGQLFDALGACDADADEALAEAGVKTE